MALLAGGRCTPTSCCACGNWRAIAGTSTWRATQVRAWILPSAKAILLAGPLPAVLLDLWTPLINRANVS